MLRLFYLVIYNVSILFLGIDASFASSFITTSSLSSSSSFGRYHYSKIHLLPVPNINVRKRTVGNHVNTLQQQQEEEEEEEYVIRFSRCYQRHVVYDKKKKNRIIQSFLFLDEAQKEYLNAIIIPLHDEAGTITSSSSSSNMQEEEFFPSILAGMGTTRTNIMLQSFSSSKEEGTKGEKEAEEALAYLSSLAYTRNHQRHFSAASSEDIKRQIGLALRRRISNTRLQIHTSDTLLRNYNRIMDLFTRGSANQKDRLPMANNIGLSMTESDARRVISDFPQLCLYDFQQLEQRISFFLSPFQNKQQPPKTNDGDIDWVKWNGGAGWTVSQATEAIRLVPQLCALYHEDAQKPSMLYFYQRLNVPTEAVEYIRKQLLPTGADISDACCFALLHTQLGISLPQIQTCIDAFPTLTFCDLDPGWELLTTTTTTSSSSRNPIRTQFNEDALHYLRKRLQIGTSDIFAMIKTHSRLSGYGVKNNILPTLNAFQTRLNLSSRELRKLILRMPSMVGISVDSTNSKDSTSSLDRKINFFVNEALMKPDDLKKAILKQPSLLQYSVDLTLRPKIEFLNKDLGISVDHMNRIISLAPSIMGLSLEQNLRPTVNTIVDLCDLSPHEVGKIIITCPSILTLSLKRKIEPCLIFLSTRLRHTTPNQLGYIIQKVPRVLLQGIETSLIPKIEMIQLAFEEEEAATATERTTSNEKNSKKTASILNKNPALLVTTNSILKSRLEKYLQSPSVSLNDALQPQNNGRKPKFDILDSAATTTTKVSRRRPVIQFSKDTLEIIHTFSSVEDAANQLALSKSGIYSACNQGKLLKGKAFAYANDDTLNPILSSSQMETNNKSLSTKNFQVKVQKIINQNNYNKVVDENNNENTKNPSVMEISRMIDDRREIQKLHVWESKKDHESTVSIVAFVAGKTFPTDDINSVRGARKAGGLAMHFPQIDSTKHKSTESLQLAARASFGMIMPEEPTMNGSNFQNGLILVGFPFLRPSRNRCELYACHGALKVILQMIKSGSLPLLEGDKLLDPTTNNSTVVVEICTESSYAWNLLKNTDQILRWGETPTLNEFIYDGEGPTELANPDLLFPLSKTVYNIMTGNFMVQGKKFNQVNTASNHSIYIKFSHSQEILQSKGAYLSKINHFAKNAAIWQFNRLKQ